MLQRIFFIGVFFFSALSCCFAHSQCESNTTFNVGAGIYDITGPAAEQRMMGYAMIDQQTMGLLSRLWARAFIIESPCNNKRIIFVNADLGQLFQGVKQQVVRKLHEKYGDQFTDENVIITATHQHSGPGGYSTYTLYNLSTLGFSRSNFNAIVDGIVAAIDRAQQNLAPAHIKIAKGEVTGIGFNRSPDSYLLNPQAERDRYTHNVDTEMTLLRFERLNGTPIGMINWLPVHGVSMNNKNRLINSDNKGYAEYLFEKEYQSDYGPHAFVAAFAQANAGDVSPNENGQEGGTGIDGLKAVDKIGRPQYETAKQLFAAANELVTGGVDYRHTFEEMDQITVDAAYTNGKPQTTCPAALGVSMLAGTTDGEGFGKQGVTCDNVSKTLPGVVCQMMTTTCQGVKPIVLQTGLMKPYPWTPNILPLQIVKIGTVYIAATPFELTTMVGRRLKASIKNELPKTENSHVVISALSNAYAQYVTTAEEYQLQRYEGASTLFGPWQSAALNQEFAKLTQALVENKAIDKGPTPLDLIDVQVGLQPGVLFDTVPSGKHFGDVYQDAKKTYHVGESVEVKFWGAHPKNNYRTQQTFLEVQRLENGAWMTVRQDRDWDTEYHWERHSVADSIVTIVWRISADIAPGQYRIVQYGDSKSFWGGKISPYTGYSSVFTVG